MDYPSLDKFDFEEKEAGLLKLKMDILKEEEDEVVRNIYLWKINEKLAQLRMLRATKNGDDRKFARYSRFIYGNPEQDIFNKSLADIKGAIEQGFKSDDIRILFAAKRLEENINLETAGEYFNERNFLPVKKRVIDNPYEKKEREFSAYEIAEAFKEALKELKIEGWNVVVDKNFANISASQEKKILKVPENRKLKEINLKGLIAHEIGTHILRRENGEKSKLMLLGLGLDRHINGEEGISTYNQQKIEGADDFAGFNGHLAISLACGLDGKKRDFRDVFNIIRDYVFISSKNKDKQKTWGNAKNTSWNICVRTFRGTSCDSPGACLTRDIVYREGNVGVWNLVNENSNEIRRFSVGRYDPTNSRHIWILEQLGITDEDLETLDPSLTSDRS